MNRMENKRIWIKGLVMQCPHGIPMNDCPLNGLRSIPSREANKVVNEMGDYLVHAYLRSHRRCTNHRQKAWADPVI